MKRIAMLLALIGAGGGGWYASQQVDWNELSDMPLVSSNSVRRSPVQPPVKRSGDTIRIASFNLQSFGRTKLEKPHVMEYLARVIRQYDCVAIQEIRSRDESALPRLVDVVNSAGRQYDYVIGPRVGRAATTEQFAFVFDRASLEVDRNQLYTVDDPDDLLHREPFVAWFRVRGPEEGQAFTFTLVNVHVDAEAAPEELAALAQAFRRVRDDARCEDDVIMLGDFQTPHDRLGPLGAISGMTPAILGLPTNLRGTEELDNLLFHREATSEFTGRSGVFDFLREYNLTLDAAAEISDRLPVWAEFSIYEGGLPGRVAENVGGAVR